MLDKHVHLWGKWIYGIYVDGVLSRQCACISCGEIRTEPVDVD